VTRNLAEWFERIQQDLGGQEDGVVSNMIAQLWREYDEPPRKVKGVSDQFLVDLDRVPKKVLKEGMNCPICNNAFLDGK